MAAPLKKPSARVVINRAAVAEVRLVVADGMLAVAQAIVDTADPPDATPFGEGLVTTGAAGMWVDGRKIGGRADKPRRERMPARGIAGVAGFGFPGRFQEEGTIHQPARPFLTPAANRVVAEAPAIMAAVVRPRLGRP
jgi:hypothetical protein